MNEHVDFKFLHSAPTIIQNSSTVLVLVSHFVVKELPPYRNEYSFLVLLHRAVRVRYLTRCGFEHTLIGMSGGRVDISDLVRTSLDVGCIVGTLFDFGLPATGEICLGIIGLRGRH